MAYKAGYQEIEQRDATDNIVKAGVVTKKTPFVTTDNAGILDVIAENFRVLHEAVESENLAQIVAAVTAMYNDMKTNPNFGSTSAAASASAALASQTAAESAATAAAQSATTATAGATTAADAAKATSADLESIKSMLTDIQTYVKTSSDSSKVSQNSMTAAAASESNSKLWAESAESPDGSADTDSTTGKTQSSKSWALSAKMSETNAASAAGKCQGIVDDAAATLAAAISKISQLIVDCGDTSEIPVQIDIGDAVYPTTICALSATQPETGTQLWIEKE
jgi:hypothetical protein